MLYLILYVISYFIAYYFVRKMRRDVCGENYGWVDVLCCTFFSFFSPIVIMYGILDFLEDIEFPDFPKPPKWL